MRRYLLLLSTLPLALACQPGNQSKRTEPTAIKTDAPKTADEIPMPPLTDDPPTASPTSFVEPRLETLDDLGPRFNGSIVNGVAVTEGVSRVRRRHENDMDFSKYNPFYWEGRIARFKVEDYTPTGVKKLRFQLETEMPQDHTVNRGPDVSVFYIGNPSGVDETVRSKFALNQRMDHAADDKRFSYTFTSDDFKVGQVLTFEFRFFLTEADPQWKKEKDFNPHTLSAYYSEFLRIRVGEAGLLIDDPIAQRFSGGWTTIPTVRVEPWKALQQQALNLAQDQAQNFLMGRTFFHTDMVTGQHIDDRDDDKPLLFFEDMRIERAGMAADAYNMSSCNGCHVNNGIALHPAVGQATSLLLAKTLDKRTGGAHAVFGQQFQTQGAHAEGRLILKNYETSTVTLDDGTQVQLRKPIFTLESGKNQDNLALSIRKPPALIGMGLLDAVPESTLKALAQTSQGEYRGRFGWKGQQADVRAQITAALNFDMGVRTAQRTNLDCGADCVPGKALFKENALDELQAYVSLLGVPPRTKPMDPLVQKGSEIFRTLGCASCHVPVLKTGTSKFKELSDQTIQPFTDLLLHDMGEGLADTDAGPYARKWRTAPLWGLKNVKHSTDSHLGQFPPGNIGIVYTDTIKAADKNPIQLLHDGRAQSLIEAILWHGGQASDAVRRYKALPKTDRDALDAFLWDL